MPNVIAVVQDDRARRQIEQYIGELGMDDLRVATFKSVKEFQELYFRDRSKQPPPPSADEGKETENRLFSQIDVLIFALDSIGEKSNPWLEKLKANMIRYKYWPVKSRPRLMMLKYEEDGINKLDVLNPMLDDLVYLPIDRLVFLQKMQILVNLPQRVQPRFLFSQEVQHLIEISKITKVDRLSDVGIAIRNPVPLQKGLPGHFYLNLPGEKTRLEMRAKVIRSIPHPEYPGQFLVYFTYFGLNKNSLTQIRRVLSKAPRYQSLLNDDREDFRDGKNTTFGDHDPLAFGVTVLDPDEQSARSIATGISKEMDRVQAVYENSFQLFLNKYFESGGKNEKAPPKSTEATDFYHSPISLSVSVQDLKCFSVDPGPTEIDKFLGHSAMGIFSDPDRWLRIIDDKGARLIVNEAVQLAAKGRDLEKMTSMRDTDGLQRGVKLKFTRGATENFVTIEISPASLADIVERTGPSATDMRLDALIVDTAFMPEDVSNWMTSLRARAVQIGLCDTAEQLKFFYVAETDKIHPNLLNARDVLGLMVKPVDMRHLMFLMSEMLNNKATLFQFDNLGWSSPGLPVHVAKHVELEALSEFGATLKSQQRIIPGTMIYLRKSIYDNAPNQCLAARVYACEEHPADKAYFQVYATYFGINDAFLKFARTWIRENYAHQKKKSD